MERQPRRYRPPDAERGYVPPEESATVKQLREALASTLALVDACQADLDAERVAHQQTRDEHQQLVDAQRHVIEQQRELIEGEQAAHRTTRAQLVATLGALRDALLFGRGYHPHGLPDRPDLTPESIVEMVVEYAQIGGGEEAK